MNYYVKLGEEEILVQVDETGVAQFNVVVDGKETDVDAHRVSNNTWSIIIGNRIYEVDLTMKDEEIDILIGGDRYSLRVLNEQKRALHSVREAAGGGKQLITAPMPGKVVKILVKEGEEVEGKQGVIIIEAMKMENEFKSKATGKVKEVFVSEGDVVDGGAKLLLIE